MVSESNWEIPFATLKFNMWWNNEGELRNPELFLIPNILLPLLKISSWPKVKVKVSLQAWFRLALNSGSKQHQAYL